MSYICIKKTLLAVNITRVMIVKVIEINYKKEATILNNLFIMNA
jgi:hypothetical protein